MDQCAQLAESRPHAEAAHFLQGQGHASCKSLETNAVLKRGTPSGTSTLRTVMIMSPEAMPQSCSALSGASRRPLNTALSQGSLKPSILRCVQNSSDSERMFLPTAL